MFFTTEPSAVAHQGELWLASSLSTIWSPIASATGEALAKEDVVSDERVVKRIEPGT
jgi:hypothetical protein